MGIKPSILFGTVMHGRLFPKRNNFTYGIYYIALPLSRLANIPIAYNRFAPMSFYDRDHGTCDGSNLENWARDILNAHNISEANGEITLICMPRILGYVFNPVSFWMCHDKASQVRAILCEVHNTFGERHTYICAHPDQSPIKKDTILEGQKVFHVSPFLKRKGHYNFRFEIAADHFGAWIDFFDAEGKKQLVTSIHGKLEELNAKTLRKAFWRYPLVTLKAIFLIHWQALKLVTKGIAYVPKPLQNKEKVTRAQNITKM